MNEKQLTKWYKSLGFEIGNTPGEFGMILYTPNSASLHINALRVNGGAGSGNFGHAGQGNGEVGGSGKGKEDHAPTMQEFEARIANQEFETIGVFFQDGTFLFKKDGDKNHVPFINSEIAQMPLKVLTHNHPTSSTFSEDDLRLLAYSGLQEIRAVAKDGTAVYSMKNLEGHKKITESEFETYFSIAIRKTMSSPEYLNMSDQEKNNNTLVEFAKISGLTYERIKL